MNPKPLISVCIPTFNGVLHLSDTLLSVTKQTYHNIEIIISDHGSTDDTLTIVDRFKEETIIPVFFYKCTQKGIGANWNNCIKKSNGQYIKFIFQDDTMEPQCLSEMLDAIIKTQSKICICQRNIIVDKHYRENVKMAKWVEKMSDLQKNVCLEKRGDFKYITRSIFSQRLFLSSPYNKIGEPVVGLMEKSVFDDVGFYNTSIQQFVDYEFWYRALLKYDFAFLEKKLVNFRIHYLQATQVNERNKVYERPLYLKFVEENLKNLLHPRVRMKFDLYYKFKKKFIYKL